MERSRLRRIILIVRRREIASSLADGTFSHVSIEPRSIRARGGTIRYIGAEGEEEGEGGREGLLGEVRHVTRIER